MCEVCSAEYHDPDNRRFHAQPNACPDCGPSLSLRDRTGNIIPTDDPIISVVSLLKSGKIGALRGIGGFHLAVDAHNDGAVRELRRHKGRAEKPFALMAPDVRTIERTCRVSPREAEELRQPTHPIVLIPVKGDHTLAPAVAPQNRYLGFMLPYTPLHYLILRDNFDALVMTSGNYTEETYCNRQRGSPGSPGAAGRFFSAARPGDLTTLRRFRRARDRWAAPDSPALAGICPGSGVPNLTNH